MSEALDKLRTDLKVLEAMAAEMDDYLRNKALFWPMITGGMPRLTLGGYLYRQHRLIALGDLLDEGGRARLDIAIRHFNDSLVEKVVRFEERAHQELHTRLRQWGEYLKDISQEFPSDGDYYASSVETRAMIAALLDKLKMPPYELDQRILPQVALYDRVLRNYWLPGEFVWPKLWQPAYPKSEYWWLYGFPRLRIS